MIVLLIFLCLISLTSLAIGIRGRVIQRGVFCRRCRFDLVGIDLEGDQPTCPECGTEVSGHAARRDTLRARSKPWLTVGVLLMLLGVSGLYVSFFVNTSTIYSYMPERIVIGLAERGTSGAIDELVVRISQVPVMMSDDGWDHALEAGLAHQADSTITWDVRWGEVLYQGFIQGRMSNERIEQYFVNADEIELTVRDRVHPGSSGFGYRLENKQTRIKMMTGGTVDYQQYHRVTGFGVQGEEPLWTREPDNRVASRSLRLNPWTDNRSAMWTSTWRMEDYFAQEPGNVVDVYFDWEMTLVPIGENEPIFSHTVREEFSIQIIDEYEPIVRTNSDEEAIAYVMENMQIAPLKIMSQIEVPKPNHYTQVLRTMLASPVPFDPLSLDVFLLIDGQEILMGSITHNSTPDSFHGNVSWGLKPGDDEAGEVAERVHARLLNDQSATVVVRTNAALSENLPGVEEVLDIELMFKYVPVEIVETSNELNTPNWDGAQGKAVPIED